MNRHHVAIIGAGPIGLELAVALRRAGIDYVQFDAGQVAQTIYGFPFQMRFFSSPERIAIAGVPVQTADQSKCSREEYLAYLRGVVQQFDLPVRTYEPVTGVARDGDAFILTSQPPGRPARTWHADKVVLATGGTSRPRKLGLPGENLPHVSHHFDDPHRYFRRRVLVVGGRNSAVEVAVRCWHAGAQVAISYRRDAFDPASVKYWLEPEIRMLVETGRVDGHLSTEPVAISPTHVTLRPTGGGEPYDVAADFVLLMVGYEADMRLAESLGIELVGEERAPQFDPRTMETNVRGVYVAGTAVAGTQAKYSVFLENCHIHVPRIVAALTGAAPPPDPTPYERQET